jgi:hypothetical protein
MEKFNGILLFFHSRETFFPCKFEDLDANSSIKDETIVPTYVSSTDYYVYNNEMYKCKCYVFLYRENDAIGLFGVFPKNKNLGYHRYDREYVYILFDKNDNPQHVYFSQHSIKQGEWKKWKDCTVVDNLLHVYVSLGSHANYSNVGTCLRVFGLANDVRENKINKVVNTFIPAFTTHKYVKMTAQIKIVPEKTMSPFQKFIMPFCL